MPTFAPTTAARTQPATSTSRRPAPPAPEPPTVQVTRLGALGFFLGPGHRARAQPAWLGAVPALGAGPSCPSPVHQAGSLGSTAGRVVKQW